MFVHCKIIIMIIIIIIHKHKYMYIYIYINNMGNLLGWLRLGWLNIA